jgi:hypothetical protein
VPDKAWSDAFLFTNSSVPLLALFFAVVIRYTSTQYQLLAVPVAGLSRLRFPWHQSASLRISLPPRNNVMKPIYVAVRKCICSGKRVALFEIVRVSAGTCRPHLSGAA